MSKTIHDDIRSAIEKADARAYKTAKRKLRAEHDRHDKRLVEIDAECAQELAKSKALRDLLPKEDPPPSPENLARFDDAQHDDEPDMIAIPPALMQEPPPLRPGERLVGKSRI